MRHSTNWYGLDPAYFHGLTKAVTQSKHLEDNATRSGPLITWLEFAYDPENNLLVTREYRNSEILIKRYRSPLIYIGTTCVPITKQEIIIMLASRLKPDHGSGRRYNSYD